LIPAVAGGYEIMALKKFRGDKLFDGTRFLENDRVLICGDDGTINDIIPANEAGDDVQQFNGILSPGFINCHCHLELSHMKGLIPEKTGLVEFILSVVTKRHTNDEIIQWAIEKAEDEMLLNGIVATGDICNNDLSLLQKSKGRMYYHNFIEAAGYHPDIAEERFEKSLDIFKKYAQHYSIPVESNSIVPHAPYSVADGLWERIISFPGNHLFTIHNQEIAAENEWFVRKTGGLEKLYAGMQIDISFFHPTGKSSLQSILPRFINNQQLILVHNVHTAVEDILAAGTSKAKIFWCLCPNANKYINDELPDATLFTANNCEIVLGTDSLASNYRLSILDEIHTLKENNNALKTELLLGWATLNGARALQMDSLLGSFEKGKRPGVVLISEGLDSVQRLA
jgi:aminodeoxyfutalosine deaminase